MQIQTHGTVNEMVLSYADFEFEIRARKRLLDSNDAISPVHLSGEKGDGLVSMGTKILGWRPARFGRVRKESLEMKDSCAC